MRSFINKVFKEQLKGSGIEDEEDDVSDDGSEGHTVMKWQYEDEQVEDDESEDDEEVEVIEGSEIDSETNLDSKASYAPTQVFRTAVPPPLNIAEDTSLTITRDPTTV